MNSKPIRIAFFTGSFKFGGTEHFLVQLLQNVDRKKLEPYIICLEKKGEFLTKVQKLNINIYEFPIKDSLFNLKGIKVLVQITFFLYRNKIQILHTLADWANFIGTVAGKMAGVPVILASQRNMGHWMVRKRYRLVSKLIYKYLTHGVIVNAHAIKKSLIENFNINEAHIHVIHNGIAVNGVCGNNSVTQKRNGKIQIGYVGRLDYVKGVDILVEAARFVIDVFPETHFLIVGDGPEAGKIKSKVQSYRLNENFTFVGYQKDIFSFIKTIDCLVLPSRSEGFPNIILEAMACKLPVIATRVGGVPELVVDGKTGLLVDASDRFAMAKAIKKLCKDISLRQRMGIEGYQRLQKYFGLNQIITRHQDYYLRKVKMITGGIKSDNRVVN